MHDWLPDDVEKLYLEAPRLVFTFFALLITLKNSLLRIISRDTHTHLLKKKDLRRTFVAPFQRHHMTVAQLKVVSNINLNSVTCLQNQKMRYNLSVASFRRNKRKMISNDSWWFLTGYFTISVERNILCASEKPRIVRKR